MEPVNDSASVARASAALVLTLGLVLAACTSTTPTMSVGTISRTAQRSPPVTPTQVPGWPRHPRVVAILRAPEPPADDVLLPEFKSIYLAAYRKACLDVTSVESETLDFKPRSRLIVIRCGQEPVRAVRLVFTGVVVPNLHRLGPLAMNEPQSLLSMLGLHWHIRRRTAKAGEQPGTVVEQRPSAGTVVPFDTTVSVVIAG